MSDTLSRPLLGVNVLGGFAKLSSFMFCLAIIISNLSKTVLTHQTFIMLVEPAYFLEKQ